MTSCRFFFMAPLMTLDQWAFRNETEADMYSKYKFSIFLVTFSSALIAIVCTLMQMWLMSRDKMRNLISNKA